VAQERLCLSSLLFSLERVSAQGCTEMTFLQRRLSCGTCEYVWPPIASLRTQVRISKLAMTYVFVWPVPYIQASTHMRRFAVCYRVKEKNVLVSLNGNGSPECAVFDMSLENCS